MLAALQTVNPQRRTVVFFALRRGRVNLPQPPSGNISRNKTRSCPLFRRCRWMVFIITIAGWMRINCAPSKAHQRHLTLRNWRKICAVMEGDCTWPQYDRQKHDPVEDALHVTAPLVIVEGNWLLLDDEKWQELASFCDFSIFIHAPAQILRERLISRKIAGGLSRQEAEAFMPEPMVPMSSVCW